MSKTAVLCIAFNRPDLFSEVLEGIRRGGEDRELFIAIDGPREGRPEDVPLREGVIEVARSVDWAPEVHLKVEEENLGCGPAIDGAVGWALSKRDDIIVIEDDFLPDPSFFEFCDELLERYRDDTRVMQIGAANWGASPDRFLGYSYAFTSFAPIWGWATWRRAWALNDFHLESWPRFKSSGLGEGIAVERRFRKVLLRDFEKVRTGGGTWDHQWQYSILRHHGLNVVPSRNLVVHLGYRPDATQAPEHDQVLGTLPLDSLEFPLVHPPEVARNPLVESVFGKIYWQKRGWPGTVFRWIVRDPRLNKAIRTAARRMIPRPS